MIRHNFRQLTIWNDAVALAGNIYRLIQNFPSEHKFGLANQLYRCAVSISSNIAEGTSRSSKKDFIHFLRISLGSAFELETQLIIANQCGLISNSSANELIQTIQVLQKQITTFARIIEK